MNATFLIDTVAGTEHRTFRGKDLTDAIQKAEKWVDEHEHVDPQIIAYSFGMSFGPEQTKEHLKGDV